eukprot:3147167-Pleurochrysis_carterae.AAC.2
MHRGGIGPCALAKATPKYFRPIKVQGAGYSCRNHRVPATLGPITRLFLLVFAYSRKQICCSRFGSKTSRYEARHGRATAQHSTARTRDVQIGRSSISYFKRA